MTAQRTPVLLSVNVGRPKNVPWQGKTVYTGAWKHPVDGPAMVRRLNIDGDRSPASCLPRGRGAGAIANVHHAGTARTRSKGVDASLMQ